LRMCVDIKESPYNMNQQAALFPINGMFNKLTLRENLLHFLK